MKIINTSEDLTFYRNNLSTSDIGFIPTMGALHEGHAQLIKQARSHNQKVILSIFVNPTQFNNPDDFEKYPSQLESDFKLASTLGVDAVFNPSKSELYPDEYTYKVIETDFSKLLCGAHRPGHFDGVLTVVLKLLLLTRPSHAYFGEKDFQQLTLIKSMVKSFFIDTQIVGLPTVRENSGLALSSRNARLTVTEKLKAPEFYKILTSSTSSADASRLLTQSGFKVDYVEDKNNRRYGAVFLGEVRLIDNVSI